MVMPKFLLTIMIVNAFYLSSCLFNAEEEPVELGPEVSTEEVNSALMSAAKDISPLKMQAGDYVEITETFRTQGSPSEVTGQTIYEIIEKNEMESEIHFLLITKEFERGELIGTFEDTLVVKKDAPSLLFYGLQKPDILNSTQTNPLNALAVQLSNEADMTFHNLQERQRVISPPRAVAEQPNCAGLNNCRIVVTEIEFDQVIWQEQEASKTHFTFQFSADVPFLAQQIQICANGTGDVDGRVVAFTQCIDVTDFRFGQPAE